MSVISVRIDSSNQHTAPVFVVKVSRPYFSTRLQGAREKLDVWGRDYPVYCHDYSVDPNIVMIQAEGQAHFWLPQPNTGLQHCNGICA